jgi:hypothetical protein
LFEIWYGIRKTENLYSVAVTASIAVAIAKNSIYQHTNKYAIRSKVLRIQGFVSHSVEETIPFLKSL